MDGANIVATIMTTSEALVDPRLKPGVVRYSETAGATYGIRSQKDVASLM